MLDSALLNLTHKQQQDAVEQIQLLMAQGLSSGEAIARVALQLREQAEKEKQCSYLKKEKIL